MTLVIWLTAAVVFAAADVMPHLPPVAIPAMIWGLVITAAVAVISWPSLRAELRATNIAWPVALHILRAPIGAAFIVLGQWGEVDPTFVRVAGVGDIVAGLGALGTAVAVARFPARRSVRWLLAAWNLLALADIIAVFITAQGVLFWGGGLQAMRGFFRFPLPMLPSFLVPMILLTHAWIFIWLGREKRSALR